MKKALLICGFLIVLFVVLVPNACMQKEKSQEYITLWHWMTDRDDALQELAKKYQEKTGIQIRIDLFAPSDIYIKKITACAQAKALPDIYGMIDKKKIFASYIKNGYVTDLTEAFQANNAEWEKSLFEKSFSVGRFSEDNSYGIQAGIYAVPLDITNVQMLYNKKLLRQAGIDFLPETFDEFLSMTRNLNKHGFGGFVSGWGEAWMTYCFAMNYAFNIMGEKKVMDTIVGKVPYTDEDWIKVFDIFRRMRESEVLIEGIVTKGNKFAEQDFALERAVFAFNGSWCVNVYQEMNPQLEYAPMVPPPINPKRPMTIWGGAGSSFVVNARSLHKKEAIKFLKWLTEQEQQAYLADETKNLPANKKALSATYGVLRDFADAMDLATHPTTWKYNEEPIITETFNRGIQAILIGEKTPRQVAEEVEEFKEKVIKRQE